MKTVEEIAEKMKKIIKNDKDMYKKTNPVFKSDRAKFKRSAKWLRGLLKVDFPYRLFLESWIHPHPIYKKILGMDDEYYNWLIEEKKKADRRIKEILKYDKKLRRKLRKNIYRYR